MLGRRRYERVPFFCPLQVIALQGEAATVPGSSLDISIGGVGLTAPRPLERGAGSCSLSAPQRGGGRHRGRRSGKSGLLPCG